MKDDTIKRSDVIDAVKIILDRFGYREYSIGFKWAMSVIETLPSADRPQGEWIYGEHDVAMCDGYRCNRCDFFVPWDYEHKFIDFINDYHYCPNCGARMKGADDE